MMHKTQYDANLLFIKQTNLWWCYFVYTIPHHPRIIAPKLNKFAVTLVDRLLYVYTSGVA